MLWNTSWATRLCSGFLLSALFFVCMSLYISVFTLFLSLPNLTLDILPADPPVHLSISLTPPSPYLTPPSLFTDKKFPVEAHFWLDELFYYIDYRKITFLMTYSLNINHLISWSSCSIFIHYLIKQIFISIVLSRINFLLALKNWNFLIF